jgi:hypothetical protein
MKVALNGPIYLIAKFHIFLRSLANFTDPFLFLCHWKRENEYWKSVFIFLSGRACQPDPTRSDPQSCAHGTRLAAATAVLPQSPIALPRACASLCESQPRRIASSHSRAPVRCRVNKFCGRIKIGP